MVKLVFSIPESMKHTNNVVELVIPIPESMKHIKKVVKLVFFLPESMKHTKQMVKLVFPRSLTQWERQALSHWVKERGKPI